MASPSGLLPRNCRRLVECVQHIAERALPPGWRLVAFGSFIQDTALPGAALDVALVPPPNDLEAAFRGAEAGELLVWELTRTERFSLEPTTGGGPLRLLVGDFSNGRRVVLQELALHVGDEATGGTDLLLRKVFDRHRFARDFAVLVKHWAKHGGIIDVLGGSFMWTLLVVFALQRGGWVPPLRDLDGGGGSAPRAPDVSSLAMARAFVDAVVEYTSAPLPRPAISLWTGSLVPLAVAAADPWRSGQLVAGRLVDLGRRVLGELYKLRRDLHDLHAARKFGVELPPQHAGKDWRDALPPSVVVPPPVDARPERGSAQGARVERTPPRVHRSREPPPLASIREADGDESLEADTDEDGPSARSSAIDEALARGLPALPAALVASRWPPPQGPPAAAAAAARPHPLEEAIVDPRHARRLLRRWHIEADWSATASAEGLFVERTQLDVSMAGGLDQRAWARRFNRRETQIMLGKITAEYAAWSRRFAERGRQEGDPETPRVPVMSTKSQFERLYLDWRKRLGRAPP